MFNAQTTTDIQYYGKQLRRPLSNRRTPAARLPRVGFCVATLGIPEAPRAVFDYSHPHLVDSRRCYEEAVGILFGACEGGRFEFGAELDSRCTAYLARFVCVCIVTLYLVN
jgi:hypothetical protein